MREAEVEFRRVLVADFAHSRWVRAEFADISPKSVWLWADGSAEIANRAFVDGEQCVWVAVSPTGEYAGWRAE